MSTKYRCSNICLSIRWLAYESKSVQHYRHLYLFYIITDSFGDKYPTEQRSILES